MIRITLFLTFFIFYFVSYSQSITSKWTDSTFVMDGNTDDWSGRPSMYNADAKLFYGVYNNDEFLYLRFMASDKQTQTKLMVAGFTLDFAVKSKTKLKASIIFPVMERPEGENPRMNANGDKFDPFTKYALVANYASIEGFMKAEEVIPNSNTATSPFTFCIGWSGKQNMIIELQIPLTELYGDNFTMDQVVQREMKITPKLKAMEEPSKGDMQGQGEMRPSVGMSGGGGRQGGGGGRSSGGTHGGGSHGGGNTEGRDMMFSQQSFALKVQLSSNE